LNPYIKWYDKILIVEGGFNEKISSCYRRVWLSGIFTPLELLKHNKNIGILMLDEGRNIKIRKCHK